MSPDLGGGAGPGGAGRGRIEPTLGSAPKPRIQMKPGETMAQAIARTQQSIKPSTSTTPSATPKRTEPKLDQTPVSRSTSSSEPKFTAKDYIEREKAKIQAGKPTTGEWWREKPIRRTIGPIAGAAAGAGMIGSLAKNIIGKKPDEDWADVAGNVAGDVADVATSMVTKGAEKAGERIGKAERAAGVAAEPEDFMQRDRQNMPPEPTKDFRIPPEGRQGLDEMIILTKHPRTGEMIKLNVENIVQRQKYNAVYESFNAASNLPTDWRCSVWSTIPVSKLLKGKNK